jgi:hypothetical protein
VGFEPTLGSPLHAITRIYLEPRVSWSEAACSKRLVRMVPGSGRNWIAGQPKFNNPTSTKLKTKNMKTLHLKHSINRSSLRLGLLLIPLALVCFAFLPTAQAVNPAPDGVYPGANTAEGGALALPPAPTIQPSGFKRSISTPVAAGTRQSGGPRSFPTPVASATQRLVIKRWLTPISSAAFWEAA